MPPMSTTVFPKKLLWMDLEMTGLDYTKDVILEVAVQVTDFDFHVLAEYESYVKQDKEVVLDRMSKNSWWMNYPENRDAFITNIATAKTSNEVEQDLIQLVAEHFDGEPAILAGNSIHNDRNFIKFWWPKFDLGLHYRMLDVTSLKIIMQGKYSTEYTKQEAHRASGDIQESIAELRYYLKWLHQHE